VRCDFISRPGPGSAERSKPVVSSPMGRTWAISIGAAAVYVDKISQRRQAGRPSGRATDEFVINLKTAKALGLTIPPCPARAGGRADSMTSRRAFLAEGVTVEGFRWGLHELG